MSLSIVALRGSVPQQWALDFKLSIGKYCGFSIDQRAQLQDIWKELSDVSGTNKRSAGIADVVTLGDAWLGPAVARRLVQPIAGADSCRWWRMLPPAMRAAARRNPVTGAVDPAGPVYGAPYRWGCTLVAYRRDRLLRRGGSPVLDWSDLLQPALQGRIAMVDSPRELLAVALRTFDLERLGLGINSSAAQLAAAGVTEQALQERVAALRRQVRLFSGRDHVRALQAGDVWAVVGYSHDLVLLAERSGNVELVAPLSGTQLWADVWAVPAGAQGGHRKAGPSPLLPVWIEFTLSPGRISGQPGLKGGAPSVLLPGDTGLPGLAPAAFEPAASSSGSSSAPSAVPVLASIHEHRKALLAARQAVAERSPLAAAAAALAAVPGLGQLMPASARERVAAAAPDGAGASGQAPPPPPPASSPEEQARRAALYPPVELRHQDMYLPPAPVLRRSAFLEPLDEATAELYRRVLLAATAAAAAPPAAPAGQK
ncbi:hypothetical protein HXX76_012019 [Chlamydomonas incerta]|uniref:Uncharacterized protein n=1 Tax=Chlamydomonas incerta TaxID=51695 RepID=A0A835SJA5_CHLIN|nr:hypothetical protein HXX76_012019 [Chlamydomonas incerta]|eukprot:KAG2428034.1 hypothetical protein HXX76_012019 [Chlamydomonas incerta]